MTSRVVDQRPGAAARRVDEREPRTTAVIRADQRRAAERTGRERLRVQIERSRAALAGTAQDQPLAGPGARVEDRIDPVPAPRRRWRRSGAPRRTPPASRRDRGAPSVVVAMSAIPPRAATAGPARRNQRDSTMVDGPPPAAGRWREEGEVGIVRSGPSLPLIRRLRAGRRARRPGPDRVLRSAPTSVERRVVAKPVRFRHSPATVNRPRAEVRSPTSRCMLEPSRER